MTKIKPIVKKGRKFDQVLDAARVVFMREGFEGASMDEVAATAKVSKATVYSYFPDKNLLFLEAAKSEISRIAQEAENVAAIDAPVEIVLRFSARTVIDFYLSDFGQSIFRVCVSESIRFPELGRTFYETGPKMGSERLASYFAFVTEQGLLNVDDAQLAADQFTELCRADLFQRVVFGLSDTIAMADIDRIIDGAISTFMARYGVTS
ncbi:MAG: TetR/AcrR family transcriptional regulator [Paracoccaceae bacterium]|nr:TetR/AcrR family transcriptional regulator [Paracoccaceae bacterium]MDG2258277.1 TetR/AcrR family transcriptional regulator [Paracoccaceae bacterium]